MTIEWWQLGLIILGSVWLGTFIGFGLCAALSIAKEADNVHRRHWLED